MKAYLILSIAILSLTGGIISCDKVSKPFVIQTELDTTLYPGNFEDYVYPTFSANTNTLRNVLLEDYTGHKCPFCPPAATEAANIEAANPGRVFVATIHAGAASNGYTGFQYFDPAASKFFTDFTTPEGLEMAGTFYDLNVGFDSNPKGTVSRIPDASDLIFLSAAVWGSEVADALTTPLQVNLQAESNYYPSTQGVYLHVETEFLEDMAGNYNIVVYCIKNKTVDWQINGADEISDYEHHNVHMGNIYNETWGRSVASGSIEAGKKVYTDFSYKVPDGISNTDMHFLIYVFNRDTYEVLQVIEHEF